MGEAPQPSSSSPWGLPAAVLVLACLLNLPAALSSKHVDPPRNDLLLHGQMVDRAASTLQDFGWTAFQDPWFPELNGGYPLFHHYPHLPHQVTAAAAVVLGADPWRLLGSTSVLLVFLLPLGTWLGGRMLGLSSEAAALAALVVATTRSLDGFGHAPLAYGTEGLGLYGQLWGMGLAALAGPAWLAASLPGGAGLKRMRPLLRCLLAAALVSLVLRSSLPAGWVLGLCAAVATAVAGPRGELGTRAARFAAVGLGAAVLSLGFLAPFVAALGATHTTALDMLPEERRSVGALVVLQRLTLGHYLDGGPLGPWSPLLLAAGAGLLLARLRGQPAPPILEGLGLATAAAVLLLFGRATWGDWVDGLPLVGRFHDHRYLLGLQLLAPWVIGGALAALLATLRSRGRGRTARVLLVGVLLLATAGQLRGVQDARQAWAERGVLTESPQRQELLRRASAAGSARLALTRPEPLLDGTTELSWLRRAGFPTFGRPLYHYSHIFDFALYWTRWIDGRLGPRGRPIDSRDLLVAGVGDGQQCVVETHIRPGGDHENLVVGDGDVVFDG